MTSRLSSPARAATTTRRFRAPGRVNIIGEHTDYSGGFVLPTGFSAYTMVSATPRKDRRIEVRSQAVQESAALAIDEVEQLAASELPAWSR